MKRKVLFHLPFVAALAAALTILGGAGAGVNTPHSGWYFGNPLLGPYALTDLACEGATCYAAGEAGTLLKTGDGGATWTGLVTGLTNNLRRVQLAGGSADSLVIGGGCAARRSDDGGQTFTRLPFTASDTSCPSGVSALAFPSVAVGYLALESGAVLSTADRGRTFSRRTAVPGGAPLDLLCTSDVACFAVTSGGTIQRTTDGASSWTQVGNLAGTALRRLHRADADTFYAVGDNLALMRSTDGGATWTRVVVDATPGGNITSISCSGPTTCLMVVSTGRLLRTGDGGMTFDSVVPSSDPTHAVAFAGAARAVAAGAQGSAQVSNDAGQNWSPVGGRIAGIFRTLAPVSSQVAYAGGDDGVLARTVDGGQTWANVSAPTPASIFAIAAPSAQTVLVLSSDGVLQRSDNGGSSYRILNMGPGAPPNALAALDADRILLVGPRIRRSTDGGETFEAVPDRVAAGASVHRVDLAGSAVVASGTRVAIVSTNGGQTWQRIPLPRKASLADADFVSARAGFVVDTRGRVWKTADGGRKWSELLGLGRPVRVIEFSDAQRGYALSGDNGLLRTTDGGRTWRPQFLGTSLIVALRAAGGTDYALAGSSTLYATTTGGDAGSPQALTIAAKPRKLAKAGRVTVSGTLKPAAGGEDVLVSVRRGQGWTWQRATVAANGTFQTTWRVSGTAVFVAQILGSSERAGAGTAPLTVKVEPPAKRKR